MSERISELHVQVAFQLSQADPEYPAFNNKGAGQRYLAIIKSDKYRNRKNIKNPDSYILSEESLRKIGDRVI